MSRAKDSKQIWDAIPKSLKQIWDTILTQNETLESHSRTIADILESLQRLSALMVKLNSQETSQQTERSDK